MDVGAPLIPVMDRNLVAGVAIGFVLFVVIMKLTQSIYAMGFHDGRVTARIRDVTKSADGHDTTME